MQIYDVSTKRRSKLQVQINWSRELTFSMRQTRFILGNVPQQRGVYCVYAKDHQFPYVIPGLTNNKWCGLVYIGSGWLNERLSHHLRYGKNNILNNFLDSYNLAYRFAPIVDDDEFIDFPRVVEAGLLGCFKDRFGNLPPANRREEQVPDLSCDEFIMRESSNFSILR